MTLELETGALQELEAGAHERALLEAALTTLRQDHAQLLRVADLLRKELEELREVRHAQRNDILLLRYSASSSTSRPT